ncbi:MAG: hypothetical protein CMI79_05570 [Candidatus Pelagibacter sp.]|nr:hypothetical protein [Candidatus Pelagibacter sp.]|tara:strand:+ start:44241 stop:44993 length:753 start_codon:yes stop_codon:yes gene_type:complete
MKEIKTQSKVMILKSWLEKNLFFRLFKLIINPKNLYLKMRDIKQIKNKNLKINWSKRVDEFGKYSVIDAYQTPKAEFKYVTNFQKKILLGNLKKFTSGKEKKILDFGCGTGRFSKDLSKLNKNASVIAVDKERKLIKLAKPSNKIKYFHLKKLSQINYKFDIIFIANVLGGIDIKEVKKISNFVNLKLKKDGILLLNENVNNNYDGEKNFSYWMARSENFYLKLFKNLSLRKVDEYKYLQNVTSVFIGKK